MPSDPLSIAHELIILNRVLSSEGWQSGNVGGPETQVKMLPLKICLIKLKKRSRCWNLAAF